LKHNHGAINFIQENTHHHYSIWYTWYSNYHNLWSFLRYIIVRWIGVLFSRQICRRILLKLKNERLYSILVNAWIWNFCRWKTIAQAKKLEKYEFTFIQRNHALTLDTQKNMREQYIKNLNDADFALIIRWFANYSFRLYEAMSLGKIPIYIDTWAKLPFQHRIKYEELFIIVPFQHVHQIGHYIDNFIKKNAGRLAKIQKEIREVYEKYFIMKNYYATIIKDLENK
jgi:hypothetical protein